MLTAVQTMLDLQDKMNTKVHPSGGSRATSGIALRGSNVRN